MTRWPFYVKSTFWDLIIWEHVDHQMLKKFCLKHFLIALPEMPKNWWRNLTRTPYIEKEICTYEKYRYIQGEWKNRSRTDHVLILRKKNKETMWYTIFLSEASFSRKSNLKFNTLPLAGCTTIFYPPCMYDVRFKFINAHFL